VTLQVVLLIANFFQCNFSQCL